MVDLAFVDAAACLSHLEPAEALDGFVGALEGFVDGVFNGGGGGAGEFDGFVDGVFHSYNTRHWRGVPRWGVHLLCASLVVAQTCFGEIDVVLDAAEDFIADDVFIAQVKDGVALLHECGEREALVFGGEAS